MLKRQLQLSSFDKKFLLKQIQENSRGRYSKGEYAVDEVSRYNSLLTKFDEKRDDLATQLALLNSSTDQ